MKNKNSSGFAICWHFSTLLFCKQLPVLPLFVVKKIYNAVQHRLRCHEQSLTKRSDCDKGFMGGKNCSSRRLLKEFVSESWSKSSLDRLIKKVDAGLPTDRIIGQGRRRSLKVIMHQTRTSRLHVAPPSVLHFH